MRTVEKYKHELLSLVAIAALVVGVLAGYRQLEPSGVLLLAGVTVVAMTSFALLRLLIVVEGIILVEVVVVSLLAPLLFEWSLRFELAGVAVALAFFRGFFIHLALRRNRSYHVWDDLRASDER